MTGIEWLRSLAPETAAGLLIHSQWYRNPYHLLDLTLPQYDIIYTTSDGQDFLIYNEAYDQVSCELDDDDDYEDAGSYEIGIKFPKCLAPK